MNRERAKELAPIMAAYGEGKTIQYKYLGSDCWVDWEKPNFTNVGAYRVKPEPQKFWIAFNEHTGDMCAYRDKPAITIKKPWTLEEYTRKES